MNLWISESVRMLLLYKHVCVCVCVCVFFPSILDIKFVGEQPK